MKCEEFMSILSSYPDALSNEQTEAAFLAHAAECPECAARLAEQEGLLAELGALDDDLIVPDSFGESWRSILEMEDMAPRKPRAARWRAWALTAAAAVLLVFGTALVRGGIITPPSSVDQRTTYLPGNAMGAGDSAANGEILYAKDAATVAQSPLESAPIPYPTHARTLGEDQAQQPERQPVILHTVSVTLQSEQYDRDMQTIDKMLSQSHGWSEYRSVYGEPIKEGQSTGRFASMTLRIPMEDLEAFVRSISGIGRLVGSESTAEDISDSYYDTQGRLMMYETQRDRLTELLGQAQNMADIIEIESKLSEVQYAIESLTGALNNWNSRANSAVVYVSVTEVAAGETKVPVTLFERLGAAVGDSIRAAGAFASDMLVFLIMAVPYLIALAAVACALWLTVFKKRFRRRLERKE